MTSDSAGPRRKRGRPRKATGERRDVPVLTYLTADEARALDALAEHYRRSVSGLIRGMCRRAIQHAQTSTA